MSKCPKCTFGKITTTFRSAGKPPVIKKDICFYCEGNGEVSDERLAGIIEHDRFMKEDWCECEVPIPGKEANENECECGQVEPHTHCETCCKILSLDFWKID